MKRSIIAIIAALFCSIIPAKAADLKGHSLDLGQAADAKAADFSGLSLELFAGRSVIDANITRTEQFSISDGDATVYSETWADHQQIGGSGWLVGSGMEYLFRFGKIYAGPFADVQIANASSSQSESWSWNNGEDSGSDSWNMELRKQWGFSAGATLGVQLAPSSLLYGRAGYVQADYDLTGTGITAVNGFENNLTFTGWIIGGGLRHDLGNGFTIGAEYRLNMYDTKTVWTDPDNGTADLGGNYSATYKGDGKIDLDENEFRLTVARRF